LRAWAKSFSSKKRKYQIGGFFGLLGFEFGDDFGDAATGDRGNGAVTGFVGFAGTGSKNGPEKISHGLFFPLKFCRG